MGGLESSCYYLLYATFRNFLSFVVNKADRHKSTQLISVRFRLWKKSDVLKQWCSYFRLDRIKERKLKAVVTLFKPTKLFYKKTKVTFVIFSEI